jgi:hypothetical protein
MKDGMARIYFYRHSSMLGGMVLHLVVDRYDSSNFNSCIFQKNNFPPEKSNFDKGANVNLLYVKLDVKESLLLIGSPAKKGDKPVSHPFTIKSYPELAVIQGPFSAFIGKDPVYYVNLDSLKANARIAGTVASGGKFYWDRPAGLMKLEEITAGGDQAFAPVIKVEAGKTYTVDYYYSKAKFDIKEKK